MLSSFSHDGIAACLGSRLLLLFFSGTVAETGLRMAGRRYTIQGRVLFAFGMAIPSGDGASGAKGTWSGVREVDALRRRLKLGIAADGSAALISIDQGREPRPGTASHGIVAWDRCGRCCQRRRHDEGDTGTFEGIERGSRAS